MAPWHSFRLLCTSIFNLHHDAKDNHSAYTTNLNISVWVGIAALAGTETPGMAHARATLYAPAAPIIIATVAVWARVSEREFRDLLQRRFAGQQGKAGKRAWRMIGTTTALSCNRNTKGKEEFAVEGNSSER
jgi:hypothetical protein